jgi:pimeloyl-ACP methyl ester carboxylesterase
MPVANALLCAAKANSHDAFDMINVWGHGARAHVGGSQVPGMWMIGAGVRLLERSAAGVLYADLNACNEYRDGLELCDRITCPVHIILGRDDRMTPVKAAKPLLNKLGSAQTTILEGCGHMLMAEKPGEVLDLLIAALQQPAP